MGSKEQTPIIPIEHQSETIKAIIRRLMPVEEQAVIGGQAVRHASGVHGYGISYAGELPDIAEPAQYVDTTNWPA